MYLSHVLRATCYVLRATCYVLRATCHVPRATCDVRRATCSAELQLRGRKATTHQRRRATSNAWRSGGTACCRGKEGFDESSCSRSGLLARRTSEPASRTTRPRSDRTPRRPCLAMRAVSRDSRRCRRGRTAFAARSRTPQRAWRSPGTCIHKVACLDITSLC